MINLTYISLALLSYNSFSPFYTLHHSKSAIHFNLQKSVFKNSISTIIYSANSQYYFNIEKVSFHNIMQTALHFNLDTKIIDNQIYKDEKLGIIDEVDENKCDHEIKNCLFWNCVSTNNGGGLFFNEWDYNLVLADSTFISCKNTEGKKHHMPDGDGGGGAAYLNCKNGKVGNCCFQNCFGCSSEMHGAAAMALAQNKLELDQVITENCEGENAIAGAVFWLQAYKDLLPKYINITGGKSTDCGGMHLEYFSNSLDTQFVTISKVSGNSAFELAEIVAYLCDSKMCTNNKFKEFTISSYTFISNKINENPRVPCLVAIQLLNGYNFRIIFDSFYFYEYERYNSLSSLKLFQYFDKDQNHNYFLVFQNSFCDIDIQQHPEVINGQNDIFSTSGNIQYVKGPTSTITIGDFNCRPAPTDGFSKSVYFTESSYFSNSIIFTQSGDFSNSIRFTQSSGFSDSTSFTQSSGFSDSTSFTQSSGFSDSSDFSKSVGFSNSIFFSNSFYFSGSEKFTKTNAFSETTQFTVSSDFTDSCAFSDSVFINYTESFSASSTLPPLDINNAGKAKSKMSTGSIIGIVIAILVIISIIIIIIIYYKRRMTPEIATQQEMTESVPSYEQTNDLFNPDVDNDDDPFKEDFDEILKSDPYFQSLQSNKHKK